jgi:hypothetical protein
VPDLREKSRRRPPFEVSATRAMGRKVSDEFTVLLCRTHHRDIHRFGDEVA